MRRLLALAAALLIAGIIAWTESRAPAAEPATAAPALFSADRAMVDVRSIAAVAHPIGSAANLRVRDRLVARMTELGLAPVVHPGVGLNFRARPVGVMISGAPVENLVGVLPGRDPNLPALALVAHYDSVPNSPGAADDAAGVASILEVIRALKTQGPPVRDILVVLTDGEESGLLGANAFFRRDPTARHIGFVINQEARGAAGRVQMFQTGDENSGTIALLRKAGHRPMASSLTGFVYGKMPNDTDFTETRKAGLPGLNYAYLDHQFEYHSPTSTPETLDRGTLQDMGAQVLGTATAIAFAPSLPAKSPDVVYGQMPGGYTLAYAPSLGWLILAVGAGLILLALVGARRIEAFPWTDVLRGLGAGLFAVIGGAAVLHFARLATGAGFGFLQQRFLLAQADRWEWALMLLALGFLIAAAAELARGRRAVALLPLLAGVGSWVIAGTDKIGLGLGLAAALLAVLAYGRPVSRAGAWIGVLLLGLILGVVAQLEAAATAFVIAWPVALAALAAAFSAASARRGVATTATVALLVAIGLGWIGIFAHLSYLSLDLVELLSLSILLAALFLWPLAQPDEGAPPARLVGPALLLAGLAVLLSVRLNHPYDARHPDVGAVTYQIDQDAHRAWRVSDTPSLTSWTRSNLMADGGTISLRNSWLSYGAASSAPAPYLVEPAPTLAMNVEPDGRLHLHVTPPSGARIMLLRLTPNTVATIESVAGVEDRIPLKPGAANRLRWEAMPGGFDVVIRPGGPGRLDVEYAATFERWPSAAKPLTPRPGAVAPFGISDATIVTGLRHYAW